MKNDEIYQRIIESADEYHLVGEEQWALAVDLEPVDDETEFEFRRLLRAALRFYARAYLVLEMVETSDDQQLEDVLEIVGENEPEFEEFFAKNEIHAVLDEDSTATMSRVFAVAEALRNILLERSNKLAASLGARF